jgi:transcription elongation GreA/GreB family factor
MTSRPYLTPGGAERLRRRVAAARAAYQVVVDDNPAALESGDTSGWHDNFAFEENQRQMHQLGRQVRELETLLGRATVVPLPKGAPERVILGSRVTWTYVGEEQPRSCWISGWDDGDPERGRVSYNSPLGAALVGAEPGDERELRGVGAPRRIEILEVERVDPAEDACEAG